MSVLSRTNLHGARLRNGSTIKSPAIIYWTEKYEHVQQLPLPSGKTVLLIGEWVLIKKTLQVSALALQKRLNSNE